MFRNTETCQWKRKDNKRVVDVLQKIAQTSNWKHLSATCRTNSSFILMIVNNSEQHQLWGQGDWQLMRIPFRFEIQFDVLDSDIFEPKNQENSTTRNVNGDAVGTTVGTSCHRVKSIPFSRIREYLLSQG